MVVLTMGSVLRVLGGSLILFVGTSLTGIGIVICNVLLIPLVKVRMPTKVGKVTGIYATAMSLMAAIASAISVPLAVSFGWGWRGSLLFWVLFLGIAIVFWVPQIKPQKAVSKNVDIGRLPNVWRSPLAWQVSLFMGVQSFLFFTLITWLPDFFIVRGLSATQAGLIIALMQLVGLIGTFVSPMVAVRFSAQSKMILVLGSCYLIGFGLLLSPVLLVNVIGISLAGLCMGASLSMAYTLITLRAANDQTTAALSGMAQSTGYYLAACGPLLFGVAIDIWPNWNILVYLMLVCSVFFTGFGYFAGKNRTI
jgi:CP family cyanate transporter-like MFS transporter